ncbi:MAG: FMN-binding glutamate synthase family protein [Pseudomonadota bacterium]
MDTLQQFAQTFIQWSALTLLFVIGLMILGIGIIYLVDRTQTTHTIRRNYPVVGRFRYWFEHLGTFFRQYFFAMDREEQPFNRAERSWVYRAAKKVDTTIPFGSTRQLNMPGEPIFLHSPFPVLTEQAADITPVTMGADHCTHPYTAQSLIHISGMSYGAISKPAVLALSKGASMAGIWLNTGEGGLSPHHLAGECDLVFQIGTGKHGVSDTAGLLSADKLRTLAAHPQVRMFEIKLSQGAKPGKGGILPGDKVTAEIARIRGSVAGQDSISPNAHRDIHSVADLQQMIQHIRQVTGKPVGIKLAVGQLHFFTALFRAIQAQGLDTAPDFITLDSADGGTGAAPQPLLDYVGMPLSESLPLVVNLLHEYDLRKRIKVIASGKLMIPGKVAWAIAAGADFVVSARGFMFALGCIQALQCNKNTCPTGITTHNLALQRGLVPQDKATRVANFAREINQGVSLIAHACGVTQPRALAREHVRIIQQHGKSIPLSELHPLS